MKRALSNIVFWLWGWKSVYPSKLKVDKTVMLAAPHTSNWDLLFAMAVYWKEGIDAKFLIKDDYTKGLFGFVFKWLGAIGVDRSKHSNLVDASVNLFKNSKKLVLMVPAEGTRKRVDKWKTGFYYIASKANVPISMGFLDYKKKLAGVGGLYYLTQNFEIDMKHIEEFYKNIEAKYPEQYNKRIF